MTAERLLHDLADRCFYRALISIPEFPTTLPPDFDPSWYQQSSLTQAGILHALDIRPKFAANSVTARIWESFALADFESFLGWKFPQNKEEAADLLSDYVVQTLSRSTFEKRVRAGKYPTRGDIKHWLIRSVFNNFRTQAQNPVLRIRNNAMTQRELAQGGPDPFTHVGALQRVRYPSVESDEGEVTFFGGDLSAEVHEHLGLIEAQQRMEGMLTTKELRERYALSMQGALHDPRERRSYYTRLGQLYNARTERIRTLEPLLSLFWHEPYLTPAEISEVPEGTSAARTLTKAGLVRTRGNRYYLTRSGQAVLRSAREDRMSLFWEGVSAIPG